MIMRLSKLATMHGRRVPGLYGLARFGSSTEGENKWRVLQEKLKDAIARSELPTGLDKSLLRAFEVSKELKHLVEQNKPLERQMLAVLTIMPIHLVENGPWTQEGDRQATTKEPTLSEHTKRFSRWLRLGKLQRADMSDADRQKAVREAWREILRDERQAYTEPIASVDPDLFDDFNRDIELVNDKMESKGDMLHLFVLARVAKSFSESGKIKLLVEPPRPGHPELGLGVSLPSGPIPVVGELGCGDVDAGLAQVLTKCESEIYQRVERTPEAVGVVSTQDKWVFLRSQDERILIDDDPDNKLQYDKKGRPTRESVERIMGKLSSMMSGPQ